jgi:hypothetical protein
MKKTLLCKYRKFVFAHKLCWILFGSSTDGGKLLRVIFDSQHIRDLV